LFGLREGGQHTLSEETYFLALSGLVSFDKCKPFFEFLVAARPTADQNELLLSSESGSQSAESESTP